MKSRIDRKTPIDTYVTSVHGQQVLIRRYTPSTPRSARTNTSKIRAPS